MTAIGRKFFHSFPGAVHSINNGLLQCSEEQVLAHDSPEPTLEDASAGGFIPGLLELFAVSGQRRIVEIECRRFHIAGRARNVDLGANLLEQ